MWRAEEQGWQAFPAEELASFKTQANDIDFNLSSPQPTVHLLPNGHQCHISPSSSSSPLVAQAEGMNLALNFGGPSGAHWQVFVPGLPHDALLALPKGSSVQVPLLFLLLFLLSLSADSCSSCLFPQLVCCGPTFPCLFHPDCSASPFLQLLRLVFTRLTGVNMCIYIYI